MSDYKENNLVVQSNQFVRQTSNNLKANEIKMLDTFISCIDTKNPKATIEITKSELLKAIGDTGTNYEYTRLTLMSLFEKHWQQIDEKSVTVRHFIEKYEWFYKEDLLKVQFHQDILPMLINLKKNFLVYSLQDLNQLKSRYSMLMYKYILSYIRQYKTTEITIKIYEIKEFLNTKNKYSDFRNFDKKVLKPIENEINESKTLPFLLRYEKQRNGKKINSIRFIIRPRTSNNETDFFNIENNLIYEERYNNLINGNLTEEEIKNNQADQIIEEQQTIF